VGGPEGASPLPAEVLVADAESSMGEAAPIDCASFTTSCVVCSAITRLGTIGVAAGSWSEACSSSVEGVMSKDGTRRIATVVPYNARGLRKVWVYSPSVRYASPRGKSWRFRRNVYFVLRERARRGGGAASKVARAVAVNGS